MAKVCRNGSQELLRIEDVRRLLAEHCKQRGAQSALARRLGVSRAYVNNVLKGIAPPSAEICAVLGIRDAGRLWARK